MSGNWLSKPPLTVLSHLTALNIIDLSNQVVIKDPESEGFFAFEIAQSLAPILHPGLTLLDLRQSHAMGVPVIWDQTSLKHLEEAKVEVEGMRPIPTFMF